MAIGAPSIAGDENNEQLDEKLEKIEVMFGPFGKEMRAYLEIGDIFSALKLIRTLGFWGTSRGFNFPVSCYPSEPEGKARHDLIMQILSNKGVLDKLHWGLPNTAESYKITDFKIANSGQYWVTINIGGLPLQTLEFYNMCTDKLQLQQENGEKVWLPMTDTPEWAKK